MLQKSMIRLAVPAALLAALAGCAHKIVVGGDPTIKVLSTGELPVPVRADYAGTPQPYFVGPYDKLTIDVYGIDELSGREVQVDAAGRMSFPLVGVIDVNGRTPEEIEAALTQGLKAAHVRDPKVSVNIKDLVSRVVSVGGEVRLPGLYPVIGKTTLMMAVAKAQGTSEFSNLKDVVVFRTVGGQRYAALYDLGAIQHGQYADPEIFANDVVMVGDAHSRRIFKDLLTAVPAFLTPIVVAIQKF